MLHLGLCKSPLQTCTAGSWLAVDAGGVARCRFSAWAGEEMGMCSSWGGRVGSDGGVPRLPFRTRMRKLLHYGPRPHLYRLPPSPK